MEIKPKVRAEDNFKPIQIKLNRENQKFTMLFDKDQKNAKKYVFNSFYD